MLDEDQSEDSRGSKDCGRSHRLTCPWKTYRQGPVSRRAAEWGVRSRLCPGPAEGLRGVASALWGTGTNRQESGGVDQSQLEARGQHAVGVAAGGPNRADGLRENPSRERAGFRFKKPGRHQRLVNAGLLAPSLQRRPFPGRPSPDSPRVMVTSVTRL